MSGLVAVAALAAQIACTPTEISQNEARVLAIHAAAIKTPQRFILDAEHVPDLGHGDAWTFRVFTTNPDPGTWSDLAGWYSVNKHTAALTDPLDDRRIVVIKLKREQAKLRLLHCLK
jgi:hypothetical protein